MTIVRPAKTAVRLPELEKNGEGGQNAALRVGSGNPWLQQAGSHCAEARRPWGDTTARGSVEVPGATLDAHWLHAANVLFCKCKWMASPRIHVLCP